MANRKKPQDVNWTNFMARWGNNDHAGKMKLASEYDVTYDTAKHWVSEGDTTRVAPDDTDSVEIAVGDIMRMNPSVKLDFVTFDIETSNLSADFSILLSAVIKPFGADPVVFRSDNYPEWWSKRADDHRITEDIINELCKHAIIITHYGSKFDIPYMRAKSVKYGLPLLPPMYGIDTYQIAKVNFKVASRRLAALGRYFELGDKSNVTGGLWMEAAYSDNKEALDEIVEHNIQDCVLLEKLAAISFPYMKAMKKL